MFLCKNYPDANIIGLPTNISEAISNHLVKPFGSIEDAKSYWQQYPSIFIVIHPQDDKQTFDLLDKLTKHYIIQCFTTPEYVNDLPDNYQIRLAVFNDAGIYIVHHRDINLSFLTNQNSCR